jgi:hypothetical protein
MPRKQKLVQALSYAWTSSATNVQGDSEARQRMAIEAYAKRAGYELMGLFYDADVGGADFVTERPGFNEMLERIADPKPTPTKLGRAPLVAAPSSSPNPAR